MGAASGRCRPFVCALVAQRSESSQQQAQRRLGEALQARGVGGDKSLPMSLLRACEGSGPLGQRQQLEQKGCELLIETRKVLCCQGGGTTCER